MKAHIISITMLLQVLFVFGQVPIIERNALITLYNATDGANWTFNGGWNSSEPVADWYGITVENIIGQDHVIYIGLELNELSGHIPVEIGNFTYLKKLFLGANQLSNEIPASIGNLSNLEELYLEGCQLSGSIPNEIGNLSNLLDLTFAGNQLTGSVPVEIGNLSNLWALDLRNNLLSGNFPSEIENLVNLQGIAINNNNFSGELDLSNLNNLYVLLANSNNFTMLDIRNGNNNNFTMFNITNNPNLSCVFVDNTTWSETNWTSIDETSTYIETQAECDVLGIDDEDFTQNIILYPNPTSGVVFIKIDNTTLIQKIHINNVLGKTIQKELVTSKLDISNLPTGVYFITFINDNNNQIKHKIIKR